VNTQCCFGPTRISLSCIQNKVNLDSLQPNNMQNVAFDNVVVNFFHIVTCRKIVECTLWMMAW
jgi:hypothetical protein